MTGIEPVTSSLPRTGVTVVCPVIPVSYTSLYHWNLYLSHCNSSQNRVPCSATCTKNGHVPYIKSDGLQVDFIRVL